MPGVFAIFRRSLYDYLYRIGLASEAEAKDPPVTDAWKRQGPFIEHLWATAAENWVAVGSDDRPLGWAMSVERDGHLELTHFFVDPGGQNSGIGRGLIARAFPLGRGTHRSLAATLDARALSLYLRSGVSFVITSADLILRPGGVAETTDLEFTPLAPDDSAVTAIAALEKTILGFSREVDTRYLLETSHAWLAKRAGRPVGYAFGIPRNPPDATDFGPGCGPMAALDPADLPALIDHVLTGASGIDEVSVTVPLSNHHALSHVLKRGGKIDPFYLMILADAPTLSLDRYIHTSPSFIL